MIVLYDDVQQHVSHAPFTRAFTQIVAHACPGQPIVIHAQESHLRAAFAEPDPVLAARLTQVAMPPPGGSRLRHTLRTLRALYRRPGAAPVLVVFLTAQPPHIFAAKLFRRWCPAFRCHLVLHGDIAIIRQWRSRNPWHRMRDFAASIGRANHPDVRFLALETHIGANLAATLPGAGPVVDVLRHPCLPTETAWQEPPPVAPPLRFGLLGIAGRSKGLDVFASLARRVPAEAAEFRLVGKLQPGWREFDLDGIAGPLPFSENWLPREVFEREVAGLHYVVLPYDLTYYGLSASGVLLDALRWRKPVIAFATPAIEELQARFGDIGHLCADEDAMVATVRGLVAGFDPRRYQAQRRALDAAYRSRLPEALARDYAEVLRARWGGRVMLPTPAGARPRPAAA